MFDELRYLLLQVRNDGDPMRLHEVRCFAEALRCGPEQIRVFDLLTRCPTHACRGCHYDLAPAPTRGEHYPPTASVAVKDTAVVNSALGLYTVHEAIFAPGRSRPLRQPASYEVRVRDAARRSRQADEEVAHVRCPAEGFTVPNLVLPRPGAKKPAGNAVQAVSVLQ